MKVCYLHRGNICDKFSIKDKKRGKWPYVFASLLCLGASNEILTISRL